MSLIPIGLAFLAAFVFICLGALRVLQNSVKSRLEERFRATDEIVNGHRVPEAWLKACGAKRGAGPRAEERVKAFCLRHLDELIKYYRISPYVDGEESRKILLEELQAARSAWGQNWAGVKAKFEA